MAGRLDRISERLVPWLIRRRARVLWVALIISLVGVVFSVRLYGDLRSQIEELLPSNAPSVIAARTVGPKLHSIDYLSVVLQGNDPDALERFADVLVKRLRELPEDMVAQVDDRVDAERNFARQFGLLFLPKSELRTILERIRAQVHQAKKRANPLIHLLGPAPKPAPSKGFSDLLKKYGHRLSALDHFRNGYYQTPEGHLLAIRIRPPEKGGGFALDKRLLDTVRGLVKGLHPHRYDPSMRVGYGSEVASLTEEQAALVSDLATSTVVVVVLVLAVLLLYFRRVRAIGVILASLGLGCAVTFGLSDFLVGHLNANTAFLGSIVIGNGINVAIILMARYREERRGGVPVDEAIRIAWRTTLAATFVAAFAAALAYASLATTSFRGFSQFGLIGFIGLATNWVAAYLTIPSLLAWVESKHPMRFREPADAKPREASLGRFMARHGRLVRAVSILLLAGTVGAIVHYRGPLLEYDVSKLRSEKSIRSGATYWGHRMDRIFRMYLTPMVIVGDTPEALHRVVQALDARRKALGKADPLREVRTLRTTIPQDQDEKLPLVRQIRQALTPARIAHLPPDARALAERIRPPEPVRKVTLEELPETVRLPLTLRDGSSGRLALAFPAKVGVLQPSDLEALTRIVRGAIHDAGGHAEAVSRQMMLADIASAITHDAPKATVLALAVVLLLVLGVFRQLRPALMTWASLLLGVAYLVGAAALAHVRVNFLNFVVLPITFGIGVDYAVNIIQRYRLDGPGSLPKVIRETGTAVALCSATTIIGYASLLPADNRALSGFGLLASLGEVTCLAAALVFMPAWLSRLEKSGWMFRKGRAHSAKASNGPLEERATGGDSNRSVEEI